MGERPGRLPARFDAQCRLQLHELTSLAATGLGGNVPLADSCAAATKGLFDYPVGLSDQARRNLQAKLFGRLEVDDRLIDDFHFCIKTRRC